MIRAPWSAGRSWHASPPAGPPQPPSSRKSPTARTASLPAHFVAGCDADETPFFIDPFDQGLFRDADEVFALLRSNHISPKPSDLAPTTVREVLCLSCRNLANHFTV